jgi:hypothetical protein
MDDMQHYVYTLAYPDGRAFYVGKGVRDRIHRHERDAALSKNINPYKENVIRKILAGGGQVIKTKLAYFETHDEALKYEIALIFFLNATDSLTNLTPGGDGQIGVVFSEEHRRKLSEAQKGKPRAPLPPEARQRVTEANRGKRRSEETRRRMSEARMGKPLSEAAKEKLRLVNTGKSPSEEARRKMSEAQKGRVVSEEERQRIGERYRGKHLSEETRRKLSEAHKGQTYSSEAMRKMGEARRGIPKSEEHRRKISEAQKGRPKPRRKPYSARSTQNDRPEVKNL